jgi:hypothetical protein
MGWFLGEQVERSTDQKMRRQEKRELFRTLIEEWNLEKRYEFEAMGEGKRYTRDQKLYAFEQIEQSGV